MACGGSDPCIAGSSTRKRSFSFSSSSSSYDDSDTDVYLVSGSEDSDGGELSSSSGDDGDSLEANIASARQWILLDMDNPPVKPPRFPFLAIPGKTFNLSSPDGLMEYIQQFLDNALISLVVDETNHKAAEQLKSSPPSEHSRLKKWVPVTKEEMWVFLALLLLQGIVHKLRQQWYWFKNKLLSTPVFGEVMSCHRFLLIMRMFHFVDNASITDLSGHPQLKLCKIWPFLERLLNYRSAYLPERDMHIYQKETYR